MLCLDNTVDYDNTFLKIYNSINSINSSITSLLYDTYTNSTFVYSDLNVIRINTSNNYQSIQNISSNYLPKAFSTNLSTKMDVSESTVFASTSQLSSKFNVSDSTNFFMKSDSGIFASTSTLSDKFNASDSTQFALQSDFERQISGKLDITDFSLYSLDFASTSQLSSKFNVSDSTFFLPSSNYYTEYLSDISKFLGTTKRLVNLSNATASYITFNNIIYNMSSPPTTIPSDRLIMLNNQLMIYSLNINGRFSGSSDTIMFFTKNNELAYFDEVNVISASFASNLIRGGVCSLTGEFSSNTFNDVEKLNLRAKMNSNSFYSISDLYISDYGYNYDPIPNTFNSIMKLNYTAVFQMQKCSFKDVSLLTILNGNGWNSGNTFSNGHRHDFSLYGKPYGNIVVSWNKNRFDNIRTLNFSDIDLQSNTFTSLSSINIDVEEPGEYGELKYNLFDNINNINIHANKVDKNTFSSCKSVSFCYAESDYSNVMSSVKYVEIDLHKNTDTINLRNFLGLSNSCRISGINVNLPPNDYRKTMIENQIGNLTTTNGYHPENLMYLSFNSTNDWINSGFRNTLSSSCLKNWFFWNYSGNSKLNVQGSISTSTGKITDLANKYFQPKFSPNYNSLKHYMVLYGDSFKDYFELDPHALEAGHNNNACENILLQQDYTFYSTLATAAGKDSYTFIQWPSTEITFNKSDYSNNTLLNTISNITRSLGYPMIAIEYSFGTDNFIYTHVGYELYSSLASKLGNTSSSSQIYAGFSTSGLLTQTAQTHSYIRY